MSVPSTSIVVVPPKQYLLKKAIKPTCGVKPSLFSKYALEDHRWLDKETRTRLYRGCNMEALFDALIAFSNMVIKVKGMYWMKNGLDSNWHSMGGVSNTVAECKNIWLNQNIVTGSNASFTITSEFLDIFFSGELAVPYIDDAGNQRVDHFEIGSCPHMHNIIGIPFGPEFIGYNGEKRLNIWVDRRLNGDAAHRTKGRLILRMIYRAICAGDELDSDINKEMDILEEQVLTDTFTSQEFRFVIHYLAELYQRPGVNILSNLWLCGTLEGIGKGTLLDLMSLLIGSNLSCLLDQSDIERGWSDHLLGKVLVEVDELDTSGQGSWNGKKWANWIKDKTIKDVATFTERKVGVHEVINIGNYIFTMNDETPIYLDKSDRRNYFVKTTDDAEWVRYAAEINEQIVKVDSIGCATGLGWFLERVDVDRRFINRGHTNAFKQSIQSGNIGEVEEWITLDETLTRNVWIRSSVFYMEYFNWSKKFVPDQTPKSLTYWATRMKSCYNKREMGVDWKAPSNQSQFLIGAVIKPVQINGDAIAREITDLLEKDSTPKTDASPNNSDIGPLTDKVPPPNALTSLDVKIDVIADFSKMTSMEKMRAKLLQQESVRDDRD